jgi:asparagine synthase (glutamine-hydrolysing)
MCGIFGWVLRGEHRQDYDTLVRLTNLMKHRGPDGAGYRQSDTADQRYQVSLGHRRLSIIDLEGGAQPMWSADGSIGLPASRLPEAIRARINRLAADRS